MTRLLVVALLATSWPLIMSGTASAARGQKTIAIADASVTEGDLGSQNMSFRISTSGARGGGAVSVSYATANVTATAGADYTAKSGSVSLPGSGCRCANVVVPILGDDLVEGTETFVVNLSNASGAVIGDGQAVGTITDEDVAGPALSIDDVAVTEGDAGTTQATFTVTATFAPTNDVTVDYATLDGIALDGLDYQGAAGTLTISAGQTSAVVSIPVTGDTTYEPTETFSVVLSNAVGASIADASGVGSILNDDAAPTALTLKAVKRSSSVKAVGRLEVAEAGLSVEVSLERKKRTRWILVSSKAVVVKSVGDLDGDTWPDAKYVASFPRPARGSYRFVVSFLGAPGFDPCSRTVSFKL